MNTSVSETSSVIWSRVVVLERKWLREPLAVDGDDVLGERLRGESIGVDVADDVTAGVAFARAIDAGLVLIATFANILATYGYRSTRA
jgi:hypothetical protein